MNLRKAALYSDSKPSSVSKFIYMEVGMPTTYAHYTFGKNVLKNINEEIREKINKNIDLYNIGLHGPDILFYYKPLKPNKIIEMGNEIHEKDASAFFEKAKKTILTCENYDGALAYIAGFICHYMLDSECHPYIRLKENIISHNEIETEFDRYLMLKDNLNPITFKPTHHIVPKIENAECVSWFFPGTKAEEILSSLKSMKFYLNLLTAPTHIQRAIIIGVLKISGNESLIDLIKKYSPNEGVNEINNELVILYENAIIHAASLVNDYFQNINTDKLNDRFNRNFG